MPSFLPGEGGRDQIGMVAAITSEQWPRSDRNTWPSCSGIRSLAKWLAFYNDVRPHQSLEYQTPREKFEGVACEYVENACASLRDAPALPTYSQAHQQEKQVIMY
jgi:Integrase core domain